VAARSKLKKIQCKNGRGFNTWDIAETMNKLPSVLYRVVDNQRPSTLTMSSTSKFSFTSSEFSRLANFVDIWTSTNSLEKAKSCGSLAQGSVKGDRGNDQRYFWNRGDVMSTSKEQRWYRGSGKSRCSCKSPIKVLVRKWCNLD
jgi:hypothetical protein